MPTQVRHRLNSFSQGILYELFVTDCATCGIVFAIPNELDDRRRVDGRAFYCPNGHQCVYSNADLKSKLAEAERQRDAARASRDAARDQAAAAERRASAARGQVTKIKRRVQKGVCPCCNRHFENLERHMASKHPDVAA